MATEISVALLMPGISVATMGPHEGLQPGNGGKPIPVPRVAPLPQHFTLPVGVIAQLCASPTARPPPGRGPNGTNGGPASLPPPSLPVPSGEPASPLVPELPPLDVVPLEAPLDPLDDPLDPLDDPSGATSSLVPQAHAPNASVHAANTIEVDRRMARCEVHALFHPIGT